MRRLRQSLVDRYASELTQTIQRRLTRDTIVLRVLQRIACLNGAVGSTGDGGRGP
jgi:hypothetical protein